MSVTALMTVTLAACGGSSTHPAGATSTTKALTPFSAGVSGVSGSDLAIYTAQAENLFAKNGLDITLSHLTPTVGTEALASGSIDVFGDGPNIVTSQLRQAPIKAIARYIITPDYLYARAGSGITSVADLKGKVFAISSPGGTFDTFSREAMQAAGLIPGTNVKIIYVGSATTILAAVQNGTADAGVGNFSTLEAALARGMVRLSVPNATQLPSASADFLGVNVQWASAHRGLVRDYLRSILDGTVFDQNPKNKAKVLSIIESTYSLHPTEAAAFYKESVPFMQRNMAVPFSPVAAILASAKGGSGQKAAGFIDNSYAKGLQP